MPRETHILSLFHLFRELGYDGVRLSNISEATGLGKASLYHHFPGGKDEMAMATLEYAGNWLELNVSEVLRENGDAQELLQEVCDRLSGIYENGYKPCIWGTLTLGPVQDDLHTVVKQQLQCFMASISQVLINAGLDASLARERSEDALMQIQGALVVARGLDDPKPFQRVVKQLPKKLCEGL